MSIIDHNFKLIKLTKFFILFVQLIPHVKITRLDGNQLSSLNARFFGAFKKPTTISIQRNNIDHLPEDVFDLVKGKIKNVDLRNQRNKVLKCLPPRIFTFRNIKLRT